MSATEKQILVFSFYRDAELRGARLLFNLLSHMKDGEAQIISFPWARPSMPRSAS